MSTGSAGSAGLGEVAWAATRKRGLQRGSAGRGEVAGAKKSEVARAAAGKRNAGVRGGSVGGSEVALAAAKKRGQG